MTDRAPTTQRRILLIEDNQAQCDLLEQALAQHGFGAVMQVEHGLGSALAILEKAASEGSVLPTLILLDLDLEQSSGLEVLRRLRRDSRLTFLPVVILTASDDPLTIRDCYAQGANGYVVKPDTMTELVDLIGDLCRYWLTWNRSAIAEISSGSSSPSWIS